MGRIVPVVRRYPFVLATVAVGVGGLALLAADRTELSRWVVSLYALAIAAKHAWSMVVDLRHGRVGLDVLAVMAIVSTVLVGDHWAALIVVLMLTGGAALEDYASARARREVAALLARAPQHAHRVGADGTVEDVPVDDVLVGDLLLVKPGEAVPVDGTLEGSPAAFDESSLTGESLPVEHAVGDPVLSGSVSEEQVATVRATELARDSQYQQIVELVQAAADTKAPIVRLADRYAVPFTAVALLIAGVAWAVSGDPVRFAEVLVVATPCPLLIAAPVAFIAGMSRAAKNGVIIKSGGVLEQLARIRTAAFDKTGTLTHGRPQVEDVELLDTGHLDADEVLRFAAAAEQYSPHVLAQSVVDAARARHLVLPAASEVEESTAAGVTAVVDGRDVVVGKASHVAGVTGRAVHEGAVVPGRMTVYVGVDGVPVGRLVLADEIRADAAATLARLRALGVRHEVMLTGDAEPTARHVAERLGVTDVRAGLLPVDKVKAVAGLPDRPVMMIGDGVNDAPVLAAADVGVAMGAKGSTAASESADVVVMLDDIGRVARTVAIARRTVRVALQAIGVGIALSVVLMVVAAFGLIPAIVGATLQEVVDLIAILGGLRAVRPGRDEKPTAGARDPHDGLVPMAERVTAQR
ncbi:heavy metal translocating P-type ATPase [Cellulomonas soli]|uniref:Cobalt ABC transporter ATP-binding protein n=1 Tax=Cellulomonas soli TaxID=931535 RepID=A0A512PAH4_9CELL|nr:heavy metal translocating P-type ATPase [Cellulomonas soli]NYI60696.1 heavy metal translocating P-type ATPase [Cellulomonas soli]GEP68211.1 cobalt ABC transporter ATP-binding protein [Cellulomonas soli]